jgi:hypothetical protein
VLEFVRFATKVLDLGTLDFNGLTATFAGLARGGLNLVRLVDFTGLLSLTGLAATALAGLSTFAGVTT